MENQEPLIPNPLAEIMSIKSQIHALGANDAELGQIDQILKLIIGKELTPEEGVTEARKILEGKQDYH